MKVTNGPLSADSLHHGSQLTVLHALIQAMLLRVGGMLKSLPSTFLLLRFLATVLTSLRLSGFVSTPLPPTERIYASSSASPPLLRASNLH
jgi:hypothetical protein